VHKWLTSLQFQLLIGCAAYVLICMSWVVLTNTVQVQQIRELVHNNDRLQQKLAESQQQAAAAEEQLQATHAMLQAAAAASQQESHQNDQLQQQQQQGNDAIDGKIQMVRKSTCNITQLCFLPADDIEFAVFLQRHLSTAMLKMHAFVAFLLAAVVAVADAQQQLQQLQDKLLVAELASADKDRQLRMLQLQWQQAMEQVDELQQQLRQESLHHQRLLQASQSSQATKHEQRMSHMQQKLGHVLGLVLELDAYHARSEVIQLEVEQLWETWDACKAADRAVWQQELLEALQQQRQQYEDAEQQQLRQIDSLKQQKWQLQQHVTELEQHIQENSEGNQLQQQLQDLRGQVRLHHYPQY